MLPILLNSIAFIVYLLIFAFIIEHTIFSENKGFITILLIVLYLIFAPLIYSIFTVGLTIYLYSSLTGEVPFESFFPYIYILSGIFIITQPLFIFYEIEKLVDVMSWASLSLSFISIAILLKDPGWNEQLEKSIGISMPSIGMLMLVCNIILFIATIVLKINRKNNRGIDYAESN